MTWVVEARKGAPPGLAVSMSSCGRMSREAVATGVDQPAWTALVDGQPYQAGGTCSRERD
jgi:hypothetical protein